MEQRSTLGEHLFGLHEEARRSIEQSILEQPTQLGRLLQLDLDVRSWESCLTGTPSVDQLAHARKDLAFAIYSASSGAYSHAYAGLRLFLELGFASVFFSVNELKRRMWHSDRFDFSWSKALDENDGVLSARFVREFNVEACQDAPIYAKRAAECYRKCSEFMHGKSHYTRKLPSVLSYSSDVMRDWCETACVAAECLLFLLFCRFAGELLPTSSARIGQSLEFSFGHLAYVRKVLGLPVEE